jgi:hypothetical protein
MGSGGREESLVNRDALRATAHNGCIQPVRGSYGAIHVASHRRPRATLRPRSVALVLLVVGLGVAAYFFLAGALSPRPSVRILSPVTNATVPAGKTTVTVEVRNAELSMAVAPAKGVHLHYYLDANAPSAQSQPVVPTTGAWASSTKTTHEWNVTGAGLHILAVQLVTSDDRPLNPPAVAAVVVQVPKTPSTSAPSSTPTKTSPAKAEGGC